MLFRVPLWTLFLALSSVSPGRALRAEQPRVWGQPRDVMSDVLGLSPGPSPPYIVKEKQPRSGLLRA